MADDSCGPVPKRAKLREESADAVTASDPPQVEKAVGFLHEGDVGISEYLNPHSGFFAILKQRWVG